jgi:cytochrome P450
MASAKVRPPGPRGAGLAGNLGEYKRDRLDFLMRCARDYGDVVALRFGFYRIYLVSNPDDIETILVHDNHNYIKHFALRMTPLVLGKGLLTSEGDLWLRQRRLIQPAFGRQRIASYASIMVNAAEQLMTGWRSGETCDVLVEMMRLTLAIAAQTLFGADVSATAPVVNQALQVLQQSFLARFNSLAPLPTWFPSPTNIRLRRAVGRLDDIIYGIIRRRRANREERGDLLSLLLQARDEVDNSRMTDRQVRDEAMTLFLAGHETTALVLAWTWYLLSQHPEVEARLVEEVRAVLGERPATAEDCSRLRYTEAIIQEAMRLYPPAYIIGRENRKPCEIGGFFVPKGTTLLMSQWVVQRDPRFFDKPEMFQPQRWLDGLAQRLPKYAYFPFGGGPRVCIGNTFAMMETVLVLATLARRFRFTMVPGHVVRVFPTFTLRPQNGLPAVLSPR